jgi:hypothetical protein
MRFILGIIVGVALTIGGAYVSDSTARSAGPGGEARPMVNWDVVSKNFDSVTALIKQGWNKLTGDKA